MTERSASNPLKTLERVKGIEPSSSAWKGAATSMISEVITENETQNRSLSVNRFFRLPQRSSGAMSNASAGLVECNSLHEIADRSIAPEAERKRAPEPRDEFPPPHP
jgi:hypothetical protein